MLSGRRRLEYYQSQNSRDLDAQSLARRARALRLMGEIRIQRGDLGDALAGFQEAAASTGELLARSPHDPKIIFNHAQNVFWVGEIARQRGDLAGAEASFLDYRRLAENLVAIEPGVDDWRAEVEYAESALGVLFLQEGRGAEAVVAFQQTLGEAQSLAKRHPDDPNRQIELGQGHAWLADALQKQGQLLDARNHRESELALYQSILAKDPTLRQAKYSMIVTLQVLGHLAMIEGDVGRALSLFSDAVTRAEALLLNERENMDLTSVVAIAQVDLGEALLAAGKADEARTAQKRGSALLAIALAHDATVAKWRDYRDRAEMLDAALAAHRGEFQLAQQLDQTVVTRLQSAGIVSNTEPFYLLQRAQLQLGDDLAALGRIPEGRIHWSAITQSLAAPMNTYEPKLLVILETADLRLGQPAAAQAVQSYLQSLYAKPGTTGVAQPPVRAPPKPRELSGKRIATCSKHRLLA